MKHKVQITVTFDDKQLTDAKKGRKVEVGTVEIVDAINSETETHKETVFLTPPRDFDPADLPEIPEDVDTSAFIKDLFVHIAQRDKMHVTVTTKLDEIREGIETRTLI